jgi:NDP-sugar pyrophosphorylase family protein
MTTKVIVMAAGRGERYRKEGFTISKPLIHYKGKPMIRHVIDSFKGVPDEDIIVVGTEEVVDVLKAMLPHYKYVPVLNTQKGPAMSVLLAGGYIDENDSVILTDSDTVLEDGVIAKIYQQAGSAVAVSEVDGDTSAFSTIVRDSSGEIVDLQEKTGNGHEVCVGVYKFARWGDFQRSTATLFGSKADTTPEIFISQVLAHRVKQGDYLVAVKAPNKWVCLGTPKDLLEAERI